MNHHRISATNPTVSIIIPSRNERDRIEAAVRSILAQEACGGEIEVIVADGMSDDGTRDVLRRLAAEDGRVRVIDNPHLIVSTALNTAIRQSRGSVIMRVDAHTRYAPDYVRQCLEALRATGADNVGGPWIASGSGLCGRAIAAAFLSPFSFGGTRGHNRNYEGIVDTVYLGCWRREVFDRVGLFDEALVRNQDDEFNLRLTRAGGRVWQSPAIKSCYTTRDSLPALFQQYRQYGYWKVRVIQKHHTPASVRHLIPAAFLLSLLTLSVVSLVWPAASPLLLSVVGAYLVCILAASVHTSARQRWTLLPVLPLVFACYHLAYGLGFLQGLIDVAILRRSPSERHTRLTRTPAGRAADVE